MKTLIETEDDSDGSLVQHTYAVESSILWNWRGGKGLLVNQFDQEKAFCFNIQILCKAQKTLKSRLLF